MMEVSKATETTFSPLLSEENDPGFVDNFVSWMLEEDEKKNKVQGSCL